MSKINKLGTYKGVNVQVKKQAVTKEEIDAQMQAIVAQNPMMEEKDGESSSCRILLPSDGRIDRGGGEKALR